jgi:tetratricopeptide (TPR) repeat protein
VYSSVVLYYMSMKTKTASSSPMSKMREVSVIGCLLLSPLACQQQTWESAIASGQQAVQEGNYAEAERIFKVAVQRAEEFGREDRRVAVSLSQLAQVYAGQGKHVEAEPVYLQALKIYQAVHGENHVDVAATLNNLGVLHRMYGQYAEAEPLLTRALAIKENLLGPDHPDVALSAANLGQLWVAQGQPEKAEPLYRRALAIRQRAFGASHPEVAKTLEDLANVLRKLGRNHEAVALDLQAREIRGKRS